MNKVTLLYSIQLRQGGMGMWWLVVSQVPEGRWYLPKSKDVRLLGERKLVLLSVRCQLLDKLGCQVTQPAIRDPQLVFPAAAGRKKKKKNGQEKWVTVGLYHSARTFQVA